MKYLVVGVGYTGRRVIKLLPAGNTVGYSRATGAALDLDSPNDLSIALPDSYSLLYTVPPAPGSEQDPRIHRLLEVLTPTPARIVYLSTSGVYGDCNGLLVDEAQTENAMTRRARRRLAAETSLRQWCNQHDTELTILRIPGIYGPGRLGVQQIRSGRSWLREEDAPPGNRIHVDDLASCCVAALTKPEAVGVFNVSDGDFRSSSWFALSVARLANLNLPPLVSREQAMQQFDRARLSYLAESRKLNNARMTEILGVTARDPETGIRESLETEKQPNI